MNKKPRKRPSGPPARGQRPFMNVRIAPLTLLQCLPCPYHKANTNSPPPPRVRSLRSGRAMICVNFLVIYFLIGIPGELLIHDVTPPPRREAALHLCPGTRMVSAVFLVAGARGKNFAAPGVVRSSYASLKCGCLSSPGMHQECGPSCYKRLIWKKGWRWSRRTREWQRTQNQGGLGI